MRHLILLLSLAFVCPLGFADRPEHLLTPSDLVEFKHPPADARLSFGEDPLQFGELRLPGGPGPYPVAIVIHGGCWRAKFGLSYMRELAAALTENGIATWTVEYRRVGNDGGGWPGTFNDIAQGADYLRSIADKHRLDLERVIAVGHSAGGHLALWLAARPTLPPGTAVSASMPLEIQGVLALAPAPDISILHDKKVCGHIIDKLMGGSPAQYPDRYRLGDPMNLTLAGVQQTLIIGKFDDAWAPSARRYVDVAHARGETIQVIEASESGHFEMVRPSTTSWPLVIEAAKNLIH